MYQALTFQPLNSEAMFTVNMTSDLDVNAFARLTFPEPIINIFICTSMTQSKTLFTNLDFPHISNPGHQYGANGSLNNEITPKLASFIF